MFDDKKLDFTYLGAACNVKTHRTTMLKTAEEGLNVEHLSCLPKVAVMDISTWQFVKKNKKSAQNC